MTSRYMLTSDVTLGDMSCIEIIIYFYCISLLHIFIISMKRYEGFVQAKSDNLPKITVLMLSDFFTQSECFNTAETRGVKAER